MNLIKILKLCVVFSTLISSAQAYQFRADAQVYLTRTYAEARVANFLNTPIVCSGSAVGITNTGRQVYSYMDQVRILPGMFAYLNVYTNNYEPFIRLVPQIYCQQSY